MEKEADSVAPIENEEVSAELHYRPYNQYFGHHQYHKFHH